MSNSTSLKWNAEDLFIREVKPQEVHDIFVATRGVDAQLWGTDFAVWFDCASGGGKGEVRAIVDVVPPVMVVEKLPSVRGKTRH